jgi:hypothetical protein
MTRAMPRLRLSCVVAVTLTLVAARPAVSHHSSVAFYVNQIVTVTGVVQEFRWSNPHTWLYVTATDDTGDRVEWACEGRAPGVLLRAGWLRSSITPGETVTVSMSPAKDGSRTGLIARVVKADGTVLANLGPAEQP